MPDPAPAPVAIFFDLDDTLLDDHTASSTGLRTMMEQLGHPEFTAARRLWDVQTNISLNAFLDGRLTLQEQRRERVRALASQAGHPHIGDEQCDQLYQSYLQAHRTAWRAFPDVVPTLTQLTSAGLSLGVITNGIETLQRDKLAALDIAHHFKVVVCADTAGSGKPDPRIFHTACEQLGVAPARCWHVGDQMRADALGAVSAGMRPVLLDRHGTTEDDQADVTTISRLDELVAMSRTAPRPDVAHAHSMGDPLAAPHTPGHNAVATGMAPHATPDSPADTGSL
ncbi:putative hydrolase of the HAD superfamily [Lipingzhangella halophila]|uniref:Putative hydrolase of the HAD superfamily n=1 Tax=Lipingzhangella halophila TaxID=1783352 RepID=A0A7W7W3N2_9ACTN|nr:HAD family hydrolase [Lipingzhangella halophila]MBB4931979.1 putative hydrolase of the HAD superfamily [Lipingzhangella halophila]